ncbi:hypothetical protein HNQ36_003038 [Afipia massiliensis]|uniref:PDZ domain-containing protein n=1 Tax=Afipia massiliensis TaxID=211460 RepID=A0A840N3D7_9BRAD|nr:hypothetical protein [Afipia massiliensis]
MNHQTASGKPEVVLQNASVDAVKSELINNMINGGYRVTKDTSYELSFDKPVQNIAAAALLGSRYDAQPNARVTYTIASMGPNIRVVADLAVITNPGSSFERRTEFNNSQDSAQIQAMLDNLKLFVDPNSPGAIARKNGIVMGLKTLTPEEAKKANLNPSSENGRYVFIVDPGSVAERAGVKKGDMFLSFAGRSMNTQEDILQVVSQTKPGATVPVEIERAGEVIKMSFAFQKPAQTAAAKR